MKNFIFLCFSLLFPFFCNFIETFYWISFGLIFLKFIFDIVFIVNNRVEYIRNGLYFFILYILLNLIIYSLDFIFDFKLLNQIWKVLDIILIIHFCKLFKYYILIDWWMYLFASLFLKLFQIFLILFYFKNKLLKIIICLFYLIFIFRLTIFCLLNRIQHILMHSLSFL